MRWPLVELGSIAHGGPTGIVDGPFGSAVRKSDYQNTGIPVLRGTNLSFGDCYLKLDELVFISETLAARYSRSLAYPQDVVFTKKGTLGSVGIIPINAVYSKFFISSNQMKGSWNRSIVAPYFVYYFFSAKLTQERLIREASVTGVPKINLGYLRKFKIPLPPLAEQKRIAAVLGALDAKIENNRKMNETLEAMAQAIFKSWFVDFDPAIDNALRAGNPIPDDLEQRAERGRQAIARDSHKEPPYAHLFPDQFVYSELGSVPAGWGWVPFAQAGKWMSGGTPSKNRAEYWDGEIPWFSAKSLGPVWLRDSADRVTALGADSGTSKVPRRSVIFLVRGMSLAKELRIGITSRESTLNQDLKAIIDDGTVVPELLLLWLLVHRETIRSHADEAGHGTKRLPTDVLHTFHLALPPRFEQDRLAEHLAPFVEKIESNQAESETLTSLRDALLPKLISGELRVPEIEGLVEDVL